MDQESGKGSDRIIFVIEVFVFNQNSKRQGGWRSVCLGLILLPPKAGNGLFVHGPCSFYNAQKTLYFKITYKKVLLMKKVLLVLVFDYKYR